MKIDEIKVWDSFASFRRGPYVNSKVSRRTVRGRILEFHMTDGWFGLGEVVFPLSIPLDQERYMIAEEQYYLSALIGKDFNSLMHTAEKYRSWGRPWSSIAFAIETAWYDLSGKVKGLPLYELFGGSVGYGVENYLSVSETSISHVRDRLKAEDLSRKVIQLKLGIGSLSDDVEQVALVLNNLTNRQILLADANGKWSVGQACEVISKVDDPRVIWEEPCSAYDQNTEVAGLTGKAVMVDQCVGEVVLAKRAADEGVVSSLTIKPAYLGGLSVAHEVRNYCVSLGMKMRIDGPWCGDIAAAAILHLAVGVPPELLIASCDLREPLDRRVDLKGVIQLGDNLIGPPRRPGLGIEPLGRAMGDPEVTYPI